MESASILTVRQYASAPYPDPVRRTVIAGDRSGLLEQLPARAAVDVQLLGAVMLRTQQCVERGDDVCVTVVIEAIAEQSQGVTAGCIVGDPWCWLEAKALLGAVSNTQCVRIARA